MIRKTLRTSESEAVPQIQLKGISPPAASAPGRSPTRLRGTRNWVGKGDGTRKEQMVDTSHEMQKHLVARAEEISGRKLELPGHLFCFPLETQHREVQLVALFFLSNKVHDEPNPKDYFVWVSLPRPGSDTVMLVGMSFEEDAFWGSRDLLVLPFGGERTGLGTVSMDTLPPNVLTAVWQRIEAGKASWAARMRKN